MFVYAFHSSSHLPFLQGNACCCFGKVGFLCNYLRKFYNPLDQSNCLLIKHVWWCLVKEFELNTMNFKMIGLYIDTLIIGHKCCSMLNILWIYVNILRELTLQKKLQNAWQKTCFGHQKANIAIIVRAGNRTGEIWHRSLMSYLWTTDTTERVCWSQTIKLS